MFSEFDNKIINQLEISGYMNSKDLARVLKVSERTIYRHMKQMLRSGYLKVIAIRNPVLLGIAGGWFGLQVEPRALISTAKELVKHPNITFVAYTLGRFGLLVGAHFKSMEQLSDFLTLELYNIQGVQSVEPMITIAFGKYFDFIWPRAKITISDKETGYQQYQQSENANYDISEIDERILNLLREDGLLRPTDIKSKLGISEDIARKCIKDMMKKDVFRLQVITNPAVLPHVITATTGISVSRNAAYKVLNNLIKNPAVTTAYISLGRYNVILSTHFHDTQSLNKFIINILSSTEGVSATETFLHLRVVKRLNIVWQDQNNL